MGTWKIMSSFVLVIQYWAASHVESWGGNSQQFLAVQIFERCPDFHFHSKRKSGRPDFWKGVHIFNFFKSQIWPSRFLERCSHLRFWWKSKCEHLFCTDLDRKGVHILIFIKNENVNTFPKIWTARFAFWKKWKCEHVFLYDLFRFAIWNKMKIRTPFRNLNGQKLLGVSTRRLKYWVTM